MKYGCSFFVLFAQSAQKEYIYILKSLSVHMHVSNQEPVDGNKNMADVQTCEVWREYHCWYMVTTTAMVTNFSYLRYVTAFHEFWGVEYSLYINQLNCYLKADKV
jgi:hypothetical protein